MLPPFVEKILGVVLFPDELPDELPVERPAAAVVVAGQLGPKGHVSNDALAHFVLCQSALACFCEALGTPRLASVRLVLEAYPQRTPAIWAAFIELVSVVAAARDDVAARGAHFVPCVAAASVRANVLATTASAKAKARRRRPARAPADPPRA